MKTKAIKGNALKEEKVPFMKRVMSNLKQFLAARYEFRHNLVSESFECRDRESDTDFVVIDNCKKNDIVTSAMEAGIDCMDRDVVRIVESSATPSYNPFHAYIDSLPRWDGKDRVGELAGRVSDDKLWKMVFHRWMLAMVAQWMQTSKKFGNSMVPILVHQRHGTKKSSFCRMLLPPDLRPYFIEEFDAGTKSASKVMAKFGLINLDEIRQYSMAKMEKLKNLVQLPKVEIPRLYHGGYLSLDRLASFIGTSNYRDILIDPTGSRRFFPIELNQRIGRLLISYRQLYAQLKAELAEGVRYWFTPHEEALITERNQKFYRRPLEEGLFFSLFRLPGKGEKGQTYTINMLFDKLRRESVSTMRDITLQSFSRHLSMFGVAGEHTRLGVVYHLVQK
jgi:predicted P-loop ATPase